MDLLDNKVSRALEDQLRQRVLQDLRVRLQPDLRGQLDLPGRQVSSEALDSLPQQVQPVLQVKQDSPDLPGLLDSLAQLDLREPLV